MTLTISKSTRRFSRNSRSTPNHSLIHPTRSCGASSDYRLAITARSRKSHLSRSRSAGGKLRPHSPASQSRGGSGVTLLAPEATTLPDSEFEMPILEILRDSSGRAATREVIDALRRELVDSRLTEVDREQLSSGEIRWRNRAQFARLTLIERGDMNERINRAAFGRSPSRGSGSAFCGLARR